MCARRGDDVHHFVTLPAGGLPALVGVVHSASVAYDNLRSRLSQHAPTVVVGSRRAYHPDVLAPNAGSGALQDGLLRLDGGYDLRQVLGGQ